jgi:hypothetical protein
VVTSSVAVLTDITDFGFIREPRKIVLLSKALRTRPRIPPRGVMEYWPARIVARSVAGGSVGVLCAKSELHPRSGLEVLMTCGRSIYPIPAGEGSPIG